MLGFMLVLMMVISLLLTLVVLLQPGKGDVSQAFGGLTGQFSSILGTRKAMDFLTKLTIGFAVAIMVLTLMTNYFFVGKDIVKQRAVTEGAELPPASAPSPFQNNPQSQPAPQQQPQGK